MIYVYKSKPLFYDVIATSSHIWGLLTRPSAPLCPFEILSSFHLSLIPSLFTINSVGIRIFHHIFFSKLFLCFFTFIGNILILSMKFKRSRFSHLASATLFIILTTRLTSFILYKYDIDTPPHSSSEQVRRKFSSPVPSVIN